MGKKLCTFFQRFKSSILTMFVLFGFAVIFSGCFFDGPSGIFGDSPTSGVTYTTPTQTGKTCEDGTFYYKEGETVTFSIGSLVLGSAPGQESVTPLTLVPDAADVTDQRVTNMLVLIHTLDQDEALNNGIQITPAITALVSAAGAINFNQSASAFAADVNVVNLLATLNSASPAVFNDTEPRPRKLEKAAMAQGVFIRATSERITVKTKYGEVKGYASTDSTWTWLGIPYAKPPLGNLRWRAPESPAPWKGVREAIAWTKSAAQNLFFEGLIGESDFTEDNLYLNVIAPKNAKKLPVMFWIHGGGFAIGSGNELLTTNPLSLPTKGVVLVTVNHRLGPFGYLAHPLLSAESGYGASGNYGQMDQIAALKWVKQNIKAFGGDPNNVTIFGESGGGGKVQSLMCSPMAKGIFHKAICQSGQAEHTMTLLNCLTLETAEANGSAFVAKLNVTTLEQARALTWIEVISKDSMNAQNSWGPNVDNHYVSMNIEDSIKAGLVNDVPFLAGANSGDMAGLVPGLIEQMPWRSDYNKAKQYVYKLDKVASGWQALGVLCWHSADLMYIFNFPEYVIFSNMVGNVIDPSTGLPLAIPDYNGNGFAGDPIDVIISAGWDANDDKVADYMMSMWTNFAKKGNPSIAGLTWPAYTTANDTFVEIDSVLEVKTGLATAF